MIKGLRAVLAALAAVVAIGGGPMQISGQTLPQTEGTFSEGTLKLTCDALCASSYDDDRQKLLRLYYGKNWDRLATEVAALGYDYDQAYFFLGAAADGLGDRDAARQYFRLARGIAMGILPGLACAQSIDRCNQLDIIGSTGGYAKGLDGTVAANPPPLNRHEESIICSHADYPDMARKLGQVGRVDLIFEVDPSGKVIDSYDDDADGWPKLQHRAMQLVARKTWAPNAKSHGPDWRRVRVQFAG